MLLLYAWITDLYHHISLLFLTFVNVVSLAEVDIQVEVQKSFILKFQFVLQSTNRIYCKFVVIRVSFNARRSIASRSSDRNELKNPF